MGTRLNDKVEAGILEIKRRLQSAPKGLLVSENCRKLRWEMERYRVDDTEEGKFKVVKTNDHACDALRYACMSRLWYAPQPSYKPPPDTSRTYSPNFQPPYSTERAPREAPPSGVYY